MGKPIGQLVLGNLGEENGLIETAADRRRRDLSEEIVEPCLKPVGSLGCGNVFGEGVDLNASDDRVRVGIAFRKDRAMGCWLEPGSLTLRQRRR